MSYKTRPHPICPPQWTPVRVVRTSYWRGSFQPTGILYPEYSMRHPARFAVFSLMFAISVPLHAQATASLTRTAQPSRVVTDSVQALTNANRPVASDPAPAGAPMTGLRAGVHARE